MKKPVLRALQGVLLSIGSPLGWMALQWLDGANVWVDVVWHPGVYVYMLLGTALAFGGFGWYVGRQEERFREHAMRDALTGLHNPRYFWSRLEEELTVATRHGQALALLIGDIDFFKRVNDSYGHATGDEVLAAVGGALASARRSGDTIARIGGEEFAVILPQTDLLEAMRAAERLRDAVAALHFELGDGRNTFSVTMSFGAACATPEKPLASAELYARADRAMYRAKQTGRNRACADGAEQRARAA